MATHPRRTVAIVPGLAVTEYLSKAAQAVAARGFDVCLLPGPGRRGTATHLARYADEVPPARLAPRIDAMIGMSVGCLAAARAVQRAAPAAHRLVLVSPVVEPDARRLAPMLRRWVRTATTEPPGLLRYQLPDWLRTSPPRMLRTLRSSFALALEEIVPTVRAEVVVVHAEHDTMSSHRYAADVAAAAGGRLLLVPQATHSWPFGHEERFATMVQEVMSS